MESTNAKSSTRSNGDYALDILFALFPIVMLMVLILKKKHWNGIKAVWISVVLLLIISLLRFGIGPEVALSLLMQGMLASVNIVMIAFGNSILFEAMSITKCTKWIRTNLHHVSHRNKVAELMIIGWAVGYHLVGATGFATPLGITAPILISLKYDSVSVVCTLIALDALATTFADSGAAVVRGLAHLNETDAFIRLVSWKASLLMIGCVPAVVLLVLTMLIPWRHIKESFWFVLASVCSCTVPALLFSFFSNMFPSLAGGFVGIIITVLLAWKKMGISDSPGVFRDTEAKQYLMENKDEVEDQAEQLINVSNPLIGTYEGSPTFLQTVMNTFPIWFVSALVLIFRSILFCRSSIEGEGAVEISFFEPIVHISITCCFSLHFSDFMGDEGSYYEYPLLCDPFVPIIISACTTLMIFRKRIDESVSIFSPFGVPFQVTRTSKTVAIVWLFAGMGGCATLGTVFGLDENAPAQYFSNALFQWFNYGWIVLSTFIGALGAFFAGTAITSATTFASVQYQNASNLNRAPSTVVALQIVGSAAGNMLSLGRIFITKYHIKEVAFIPDKVIVKRNLKFIVPFFLVSIPLSLIITEATRNQV